jgi:ribulose bisphosphate carboxylase small subunit
MTTVSQSVWERFQNAEMNMEQRVMYVFRKCRKEMTPSEVNLIGFNESACINSIRAAMTRLSKCKRPKLEMCERTTSGIWGKPEHYWRMK